MKKLDQYKFFSYIKDERNNILSRKQRSDMLNRANKYYKNNKGVLRERAKNEYRELPEEEKNIKRECGRNRYHHMSGEKNKD